MRIHSYFQVEAELASAGLLCLPAEGSITLQLEIASAEELFLHESGARKKAELEFFPGKDGWTWQQGLAQPHTRW